MDAFVFAAVLFAAACHAGWNASIKRGLNPLATTVAISIGAALVSLLALPVVGLPAPGAWPWVLASIAIAVSGRAIIACASRNRHGVALFFASH